jgi:hypothetical protein
VRIALLRIQDLLRSLLAPRVRLAVAVLVAFGVTLAAATGGCSNSASSSTPTPTPSATPSATPTGPTPTPTAPPQNFISISSGITPTTDPTYGVVDGYGKLAAAPTSTSTPAPTAAPSQIVTVSANQTIVFVNFDKVPHTASLLGPANGMNWPATFTNNNGTAGLPAGTAITAAQFSTGTIGASAGEPVFSLLYSTGPTTGMFYFGDFFGYLSNPPIRTVIIIQ